MKTLFACSRLYNASAMHARAWSELFSAVSNLAGISLKIVEWPHPANLDQLWRRDDLGLVFLCGRPYLRGGARHGIVAAPLTAEAEDKPAYCTRFIARASSGLKSLAESFGLRLGHLSVHSQSGYNAARYALSAYYKGGRLFAECQEFATPAECVAALLEKRVDVIPLDSYFYTLLIKARPELAERISVIGSSPMTAMPFLAASPCVSREIMERLRRGLRQWNADPENDEIKQILCLHGFGQPEAMEYQALTRQESLALSRGYSHLA